MTIRLRPHHLLCMLTYIGKGYGAAFTDNYDAIVRRLGAGERVAVVAGPDDVCAPLLSDCGAHCHRASVLERDRRAAADVGTLLGLTVAEGTGLRVDAALLARLRTAFRSGGIRGACVGCEWFELCTGVAGDDYRGARLRA